MFTENKFLLVENFTWLIQQLSKFVDPAIKYTSVKQPNLKGGARRQVRANTHSAYYTYSQVAKTALKGNTSVKIGTKNIPCEVWTVTHSDFTDPALGEKYPAPTEPYTCVITDRQTLKKGTASRYYVSCTCKDFKTTFQQELINSGYTAPDPTLPAAIGAKALAPAICKHLFSILTKHYADILDKEPQPDPSADIISVPKAKKPVVASPQIPMAATTKPVPTMSDAQLKPLAQSIIINTLSQQDLKIPTYELESYRIRNSKKISDYKFSVRYMGGFGKYGVGFYYAIAFTAGNQTRVPLRYLDNMEVDKDFMAKLYSLFTKEELVALIMNFSAKRPDTITLKESLDYTFVPGVYIIEDLSIDISSLLG